MKSFKGYKNVKAAPYAETSFKELGVKKDLEIKNNSNSFAWTHRRIGDADIYFISNQTKLQQPVQILFNSMHNLPEVKNAIYANGSSDFSCYNS